jgi:hypothetical protein
MIATLAEYEPTVAMGILARAALEIDTDTEPELPALIPDEPTVRTALLNEVRRSLGLEPNDTSPDAMAKVSDALDSELERFAGHIDTREVLQQLSAAGSLPSDLYDVQIVRNVQDLYQSTWYEMSTQIVDTVHRPDKEEHFGQLDHPNVPALVSLFSKWIPGKFLYKGFTLLVVGQREGLVFRVHQAWKIFTDTLPTQPRGSLLDLFKRFANEFGLDFEFNGVKSKFLLEVEMPKGERLIQRLHILPITKTDGRGRKIEVAPTEVTWSIFSAESENELRSCFVVAFNLDRYRKMLDAHA